MPKMSGTVDLEKALLDPSAVFRQPADIVRNHGLPPALKLRLLEQWEREARALAVADDEGMSGGEESMLSRVRQAIGALGGESAGERSGTSTKHG